MFVEAGEEENFLAQTSPGARDHVGDNLFVGMTEVRLAVDVINGGGDVKRFAHPPTVWRTLAVLAITRHCPAKLQTRQCGGQA